MINTFARIDHLASAGRTPWHRASALGKLLLTGLFVGLAVTARTWEVAAGLCATALLMCASARVPARLTLAAATGPVLFSLVFVLAHAPSGWGAAAALFLRPMVASLVAVWLVATTPYPDLFAPMSRVLPQPVGDGLFLTYRGVFTLFARLERMWATLVLRGIHSRPLRGRLPAVGEALGTVVLSGFDRSQRLYQTMQLRGHSGRVCGCRHWLDLGPADLLTALVASWAIAIVLVLGTRGTP